MKKATHSKTDPIIRLTINMILIDRFNFSIESELTNCFIPVINITSLMILLINKFNFIL